MGELGAGAAAVGGTVAGRGRSWAEVWRDRPVPPGGLLLPDLLRATGPTRAGIEPAAWAEYVRGVGRRLGVRRGSSVLEVGCGAGAFLKPLDQDGCAVAGLDVSPGLVALAARAMPKGRFRVGAASELGSRDAAAEFVVSCGVFEFFPGRSYAADVLQRMVAASPQRIALLDVPDAARRSQAERARRTRLGDERYARDYGALQPLYLSRDWLERTATGLGWAVEFREMKLPGHALAAFRFDAFLRPA